MSTKKRTRAAISFGLFADAHYAEKVYGNRHCEDSLDKLRDCVRTFNARELKLAINLGDLIDTGDDREKEIGYLQAICQIFSEFAGERHHVIGNHDVETLTKDEFLACCGGESKEPFYSYDWAGVHFVILDGNCHQDGSDFRAGDFSWDQAWISQQQLTWLQDDLKAAGDGPALVICHENLDERQWQGEPDPHVVRNASRVRAVLERAGNVRGVIQGHYHEGMHTIVNNIPYIGLRAMVVGPGPENNAYSIITFGKDGEITVEGYGQQESFTMGRE